MRKFFLSTLAAVISQLVLLAGPVTPEQAQKIAESYLNGSDLRSSTPVALTYTHRGSNELRSGNSSQLLSSPAYYYVFNRGTDEGFVIVSADDRTAAVLGYSETGHFDLAQAPAQVRYWMSQYDAEYQYLYTHPEANYIQPRQSRLASVLRQESDIAPLLKGIRWDQGHPYNSMCPSDMGGRAVTGCVATAMAQILRCYQWPARSVPGDYSYKDRGVTRSITFGQKDYDWSHMPENFGNGRKPTKEEADAIGLLLKEVGYAVDMNYSSSASGALESDALEAFKTRFHFKKQARLHFRSAHTVESWTKIILEELKAQRPVFYCGAGEGGGHAYVCDGYKASDNTFHFNWGWSGMANGYYRLNALEPAELGTGAGMGAYNMGQSVIVDLIPDRDNNPGEEPRPSAPNLYTRAYVYSTGETISADVLISQASYKQLEIKAVATICTKGTTNVVDSKEKSFTLKMQETKKADFLFGVTKEKYPDGEYEINYTWYNQAFPTPEPFIATNDEPQVIYFSVKDGKIVENSVAYDNTLLPMEAKLVADQKFYSFAPSKIKIQVTNPNKKEYYGPVELYLVAKDKGEQWYPREEKIRTNFISVPAGETVEVELDPTIDLYENTQIFPYVRFANLRETLDPELVGYFTARLSGSNAFRLSDTPVTIVRPDTYKDVTLVVTSTQAPAFLYDIDPDEQTTPAFEIENRGEKALPDSSKDGIVVGSLLAAIAGGRTQLVGISSNFLETGIGAKAHATYTPKFENSRYVKSASGRKGTVVLGVFRKNEQGQISRSFYKVYHQFSYGVSFYSKRSNEEIEVTMDDTMIAPNPADASTTIRCEKGIQYIAVFSTDGTQVAALELNGETSYTLDTSALASGSYIVGVTKADNALATSVLMVRH